MLAASGKLDLTTGGPAAGKSDVTPRRSIYVRVLREDIDDCFDIFDGADSNLVVGNRASSNLATQALFLLNSPFVVEQSKLAAEKILAQHLPDDTARIESAYLIILGRHPRSAELEMGKRFLNDGNQPAKQTWQSYCQALFACVDFRYLN